MAQGQQWDREGEIRELLQICPAGVGVSSWHPSVLFLWLVLTRTQKHVPFSSKPPWVLPEMGAAAPCLISRARGNYSSWFWGRKKWPDLGRVDLSLKCNNCIVPHHQQPTPILGCSRGQGERRCLKSDDCITSAEPVALGTSRPLPAGLQEAAAERARPSVRAPGAMAGIGIVVTLGLAVLLPMAAAFPCRALRPDNATASKLLGTWLYVAGAAQFPRHLLEMLLIDHGHLYVEPLTDGQELLITQHVAAGDQCLTNNLTYLEIAAGNTTLVKHAKTQQTVGTLMNLSSEDLLLIQYQLQRERTYLGLYLYARNLSMSTADREEFEHHAKCLGLREEEIIYAPWKTELCQTKEVEKGNTPHTEPMAEGTASPPPGTLQPGSAGN
ncbi:uncharacterized protein LOC114054561 [Empidonax traillii]|uniref:uncharacterized protein LOC114054561 n=1 Tax=Empidonax traillii TaxID=164674 RepID=UPI000FFD109F|nr:uncharacterized protein LOC114054561 [Empidonax traillii]